MGERNCWEMIEDVCGRDEKLTWCCKDCSPIPNIQHPLHAPTKKSLSIEGSSRQKQPRLEMAEENCAQSQSMSLIRYLYITVLRLTLGTPLSQSFRARAVQSRWTFHKKCFSIFTFSKELLRFIGIIECSYIVGYGGQFSFFFNKLSYKTNFFVEVRGNI